MPDVSLKREYVVRLPVAIPRYQRKRTRYASEREREKREVFRLCRFLLFRLYVLNKRGEDKKTPSLSPHTHKRKKGLDKITPSMPDGLSFSPKVIVAAVAAAGRVLGKLKWSPTALGHPWWLAARFASLGLFVG